MNYNDCLKKIMQFNNDTKVISLRERYSQSSFFEIISKERNETTYSAFLRWLFGENCTDSINPVLLLLNILISRSEEQKTETSLDEDIKTSIATQELRIVKQNAQIEYQVKHLAKKVASIENDNIKKTNFEKLAEKCKDSIDIFIDCEIESEIITQKYLQIIIENKIDSKEGTTKENNKNKTGWDEYDKKLQCERYYLGTKQNDHSYLQLYVYLTPLPSRELKKFNSLHSDQKVSDNHYVQINYQDIVDGIIMPMLASSDLSSRSRFFIEEFLNQLIFPSLEKNMMHPNLAVGKDFTNDFSSIWEKHSPLIIDASIAATSRDYWIINDNGDRYFYDHQPREELLKRLLDKDSNPVSEWRKHIKDNKWSKQTHYRKIKEWVKGSKIGISTDKIEIDIDIDDKTLELLETFWENNKRFLAAIMNGLDEREIEKVECLLKEVSKRDTTKYFVYCDNIICNENKKSTPNNQTARLIVQAWVDLYEKTNSKQIDLNILQNTFPLKFNKYYYQGKWFNNLFFNYDEKKSEIDKPNWNFHKNFFIKSKSGQKFLMLKMWRKDDLDGFVGIVTKKIKELGGNLLVVSDS